MVSYCKVIIFEPSSASGKGFVIVRSNCIFWVFECDWHIIMCVIIENYEHIFAIGLDIVY